MNVEGASHKHVIGLIRSSGMEVTLTGAVTMLNLSLFCTLFLNQILFLKEISLSRKWNLDLTDYECCFYF